MTCYDYHLVVTDCNDLCYSKLVWNIFLVATATQVENKVFFTCVITRYNLTKMPTLFGFAICSNLLVVRAGESPGIMNPPRAFFNSFIHQTHHYYNDKESTTLSSELPQEQINNK